MLLVLAAEPEPAIPFEVVSAKSAPGLTQRFQRTEGWTGGDVASSIPLSKDRTLWLFGDSFIGKIESGKRDGARMVNCAAAWQTLSDNQAPLRFFWDQSGKEPAALLKPADKDSWYWPADGCVVDAKLYLFCKVVRRKGGQEPGFDFDWYANDLLRIDNPLDEPDKWKMTSARLAAGEKPPRLGSACLVDGDYLYAYGLFPASSCKPLHMPVGVARIRKDKLTNLDMNAWEFWCRGEHGGQWSAKSAAWLPLFTDGAAEMSVGRVRGIGGWVTVYTPVGIGREVVARQADRPWGPWSQRLLLYRSPDPGEKVFTYGAKAHPEQSTRDGQLLITYCRNIGSLADHARRPDVYFPQGVEVLLRAR